MAETKAIEAGRETDALIEERVFGREWMVSLDAGSPFSYLVIPDGTYTPTVVARRRDGVLDGYYGRPHSADDAAALSALAMVGGIIRIERYRNADDPTAYVWHVGDTNNGRTTRHAPTLALAICRYLLAVIAASPTLEDPTHG